jgi:exopolyphosphatase/pppGpp-phosphohydrolase
LATNEANPKILATVSVPLGARYATEIFSLKEYRADKAQALTDKVRAYMAEFMKQIEAYDYQGNTALIATSSTPLRLTSWINKMPQYDKFAADGLTVDVKELDELIGKVLHYSFKKRAASVYVGPNRAGIFIAALVIFKTIYHELGCDKLTASLKGAQEAIIAELL